jgi:benzoylsuccinyl-CoA thiolase BbsA subunit
MGDDDRLPLSDQPYLGTSPDGGVQLMAGECEDCGQRVFPPPAVCPFCMGERMRAIPISRRGKLYSYSVLRQGPPEFEPPYLIGYVDMPEGVRIFTHLADVKPEDVTCDMAVEVVAVPPKRDHFGRAVVAFKFVPAGPAR